MRLGIQEGQATNDASLTVRFASSHSYCPFVRRTPDERLLVFLGACLMDLGKLISDVHPAVWGAFLLRSNLLTSLPSLDDTSSGVYDQGNTDMKVPELVMAPDWPEPQRGEQDLTQLHSIRLFWPVPSLPEDMGWLATAVQLPGEVSGQYFLEVDATLYGDGVSLYGVASDEQGTQPSTFILYEQLAYLIAQADTAVRSHDAPPARLTLYRAAEASGRYYRAALGLQEVPEIAIDAPDDDLPF